MAATHACVVGHHFDSAMSLVSAVVERSGWTMRTTMREKLTSDGHTCAVTTQQPSRSDLHPVCTCHNRNSGMSTLRFNTDTPTHR